MRDLREKLSGTLYSQTVENVPPKAKLKVAPEISKPVRRSVIAEAPAVETKNVASTVSKKKSQQKARISLAQINFTNELLFNSITSLAYSDIANKT